MRKTIIISITLILALTLIAWLVYPIFFNKKVDEPLPLSNPQSNDNTLNQSNQNSSQNQNQKNNETTNPNPNQENQNINIISQGEFIGQSNHRAAGSVKIIEIDGKNFVRFDENFDAENGPDLFVHLGKDGAYDPKVNLGKLKGNIGSQNYEIPNNVNLKDYNEVWIWCRAFSVPFAKAEMKK